MRAFGSNARVTLRPVDEAIKFMKPNGKETKQTITENNEILFLFFIEKPLNLGAHILHTAQSGPCDFQEMSFTTLLFLELFQSEKIAKNSTV